MQKSNLKLIKETNLYIPIKKFFENLGYIVRSEVKNCDIICTIENKLTVIELKNSFTLKLIYQALERQKIADYVYIGIPLPKNFRKKDTSHMLKIVKALNIGLVTVNLNSPLKTVQILHYPSKNKPTSLRKRKVIINEINKRNEDFNLGGSSSKDVIITSYKESCIQIACFLNKLEVLSPKQLVALGCSKNTGNILRNNHYNWFKKVRRGLYTLSEEGKTCLNDKSLKKIVNYYNLKIKED